MSEAWIVPVVTIVLTQVAVIATSIYLHRALAHRSLHLHPVADVVFRAALWLTTGQSRQEWVAVHRKHHTFTDREGDPHSPRLLGFWRVQLFNVAYYMREARNPDTLETFAPDLRPDRLDRLFFSHGVLGLGVGLGLLCALIGLWPGLIAGLAHAVLYVFVMAPHQCARALARQQELREHRVQLARARLDHRGREPPQQSPRPPAVGEVQCSPLGIRSLVAHHQGAGRGAPARHPGNAGRVGARVSRQEKPVNVFAFSTPRMPDWRWRIVDSVGDTLEESTTSFSTIAQAMAAGAERLQVHMDRDRPPPARAPWHRRR